MRPPVRVLFHPPLEGALNMGADDVLLAGGHSDFTYTVRFYGWRRPTVSLGYSQPYAEGFDEVLAAREGVDVVRRRTGGRAVLHARELTYSVAGPAEEGPLAGGIHSTYRAIATGLEAGLARLGAEVEVVRSRGRRRSRDQPGACFAARSRYEILASGRKLLGSAQRRAAGRILQHGSLPLSRPDPRLWRVLGDTGPPAARASAGLWEVVRGRPGRSRVAAALARGIATTLRLRPLVRPFTRAEWRDAVRRSGEYRDPAFTRRV